MRVDFVGFSRISEVACLVGRLSMDSDHSAMTQLRRGRWHWVNPNIPAKKVAKRIDVFVVQPVMTHPWVDWCTKKWYALSRFTWMRFVGHLCIDSVSSFKALLTRWFGAFVFFCVFFFWGAFGAFEKSDHCGNWCFSGTPLRGAAENCLWFARWDKLHVKVWDPVIFNWKGWGRTVWDQLLVRVLISFYTHAFTSLDGSNKPYV